MRVLPIKSSEAWAWCLDVHYAKRIPSISFAFGLYELDVPTGIVTFGTPSSSPLRSGICGVEFSEYVIELNRLAVTSKKKNAASYLVSRAIRYLGNKIIVSYADTEQGHIGYVYQACNFIYTGLSAKRTDWKVKGRENLHGQTIADESRGQNNRVQWMREKYGDDFTLADRPRKHRYVYFSGSRKFRKQALKSLRYPVCDYPKGNTKRYEITGSPVSQVTLFNT